MYYGECSHFLRYKQDSLPLLNSGRNDIGDSLRLSRAGGALDNQITATPHLLNDSRLGSIGVDDMKHVIWRKRIVQTLTITKKRQLCFKALV
jgi:hypothetical protein